MSKKPRVKMSPRQKKQLAVMIRSATINPKKPPTKVDVWLSEFKYHLEHPLLIDEAGRRGLVPTKNKRSGGVHVRHAQRWQ